MTDEGSLVTQLQRLRKHLEYKAVTCGEDWVEVAVYELRGISDKDSVRSPEFQALYADIKSGRVNIIAATALDRVTRSMKDFLTLFEFLQQHGVEFVSLKEQVDTSSPVGRLFAVMLTALAQFERETTQQRTKEAMGARAERGLWNGGRLLGYDPDATKKSSLLPNPEGVVLVNFAFDTYLECGSLTETAEALNRRGYRTKVYQSRRGVQHPGVEFNTSSVQYLLKNPAYIAQKEVNKKGNGPAPRVDAVWPPIVGAEKFQQVQRLLTTNGRSNHNAAKSIRHVHVLSGGLLVCGRCQTPMQGRSRTGRLGKVYFYYVCATKDCGLRVAAEEIEGAVVERIGYLAQDEALLGRLVAATNQRLQHQEPALLKQQRALQKKLENVKATAEKVLVEWGVLDHNEGRAFLTEKLGDLGQQRVDAKRGLVEVESRLVQVRSQAITAAQVRAALAQMDEVYETLKPHERRELMRLVLQRVEINAKEIVLEIRGDACVQASCQQLDGKSRFEGTNWLPHSRVVSNLFRR